MPAVSVGQIVSVPWGLDTLDGTVLRIYETGTGRRAVVQVSVPGADEDVTLTLPADTLEPADHPDRPRQGAWIGYEAAVVKAFSRVTPKISKNATLFRNTPDEVDLKIQIGEAFIAAEIKYLPHRPRVSMSLIERAHMLHLRTSLPVILVTNADIEIAENSASLAETTRREIYFVQWQTPADDEALERGIRQLLPSLGDPFRLVRAR
jgi:hypothetical protein